MAPNLVASLPTQGKLLCELGEACNVLHIRDLHVGCRGMHTTGCGKLPVQVVSNQCVGPSTGSDHLTGLSPGQPRCDCCPHPQLGHELVECPRVSRHATRDELTLRRRMPEHVRCPLAPRDIPLRADQRRVSPEVFVSVPRACPPTASVGALARHGRKIHQTVQEVGGFACLCAEFALHH